MPNYPSVPLIDPKLSTLSILFMLKVLKLTHPRLTPCYSRPSHNQGLAWFSWSHGIVEEVRQELWLYQSPFTNLLCKDQFHWSSTVVAAFSSSPCHRPLFWQWLISLGLLSLRPTPVESALEQFSYRKATSSLH